MSPRWSVAEFIAVGLAALLLTVILTWPLALKLGRAGRLDSGDAMFSMWNVSWVAYALTNDPANVWNANIFHPHTGTLAFSEANLVAGVLAAPVWLATGNPYATGNAAIVIAFVLSAMAMYGLARHLTGSRAGAALAALLFAFCSYAFSHLAHIQLLMTFGLPLSLWRMHRLIDAPGVPTAMWLGLALGLQTLACGYYGILGALTVSFGLAWFGVWSGTWRTVRFWATGLLAAAIGLAVVAPVLTHYLALQGAGFSRSLDDARIFSATWRSYLATPQLAYAWVLPWLEHWGEVLFPGGLGIAGALYALARTARGTVVSSQAPPRVVGFYAALAALAAWASLGPDASLYEWLYNGLPFFSFLRAPSRFGIEVTLALAVLAGMGLALVERQWPGRRRTALLTVVAIGATAGSTVGFLSLTDAPKTPLAITWLDMLPRGPAAAAFPYYAERNNQHLHTRYMVESAWHWRPLVNGYSDFLPPDVEADGQALASFPSNAAVTVLRARGARYVTVHWTYYTPGDRDRVRASLARMRETLRPLLQAADVSLFEVVP